MQLPVHIKEPVEISTLAGPYYAETWRVLSVTNPQYLGQTKDKAVARSVDLFRPSLQMSRQSSLDLSLSIEFGTCGRFGSYTAARLPYDIGKLTPISNNWLCFAART